MACKSHYSFVSMYFCLTESMISLIWSSNPISDLLLYIVNESEVKCHLLKSISGEPIKDIKRNNTGNVLIVMNIKKNV